VVVTLQVKSWLGKERQGIGSFREPSKNFWKRTGTKFVERMGTNLHRWSAGGKLGYPSGSNLINRTYIGRRNYIIFLNSKLCASQTHCTSKILDLKDNFQVYRFLNY